ncbi:MAG: hypothetical protein J7L15_01120 [Clostridiales bacterium]|nr:hypothetical protein [Clostridiales bacterium]
MTFKNYITRHMNELFDTSYEYIYDRSEGSYIFYDDDKNKFVVNVDKTDKMFSLNNTITWYDGLDVNFSKNGLESKSKSRKPLKIFSTVMSITNTILKSSNSIMFIEFSARKKENSRVSLYRKMAETIRKQLGWAVVIEESSKFNIYYTIYKRKPDGTP